MTGLIVVATFLAIGAVVIWFSGAADDIRKDRF